MKNLLILILFFITSIAFADVIIPQDTTPITIEQGDVVRLIESGIAGSKIDIKINSGKATITEESISSRVNGQIVIGTTTKSFTIKPSGAGQIKVTVTILSPLVGATPVTKDYEINVK